MSDLLTRRPAAAVPFVLALGANLGDPLATLRAAADALEQAPGLEAVRVSPLARTAPVLSPDQAAQPDYLNAVVLGRTTLAPLALLGLAQDLERAHHRSRGERWGARTLDVDVIAVGDLLVTDPELTLPHPRAHLRAFVLVPWAVADPGAVLPGPDGGPVAELAGRAADRGTIRWVAPEWRSGAVPGVSAAPAAAEGAG